MPKIEAGAFVIENDAFVPAEIDKDMIGNYIELAFGLYPADGQFADYVNIGIIEKIVGVDYEYILNNGIYAYAKYEKGAGLKGSIGLRATKDDAEGYVEIGASIGLVNSSNADLCTMPESFDGAEDFFGIKEGTEETAKDHYVVFDLAWKYLDALLAYKKA